MPLLVIATGLPSVAAEQAARDLQEWLGMLNEGDYETLSEEIRENNDAQVRPMTSRVNEAISNFKRNHQRSGDHPWELSVLCLL